MTVHRLQRRTAPLNYRMAAKGDRGEIMLYDIIGEGWFGGISAAAFARDLKALGAVKTIDLRINSDGGDVFEGRAMHALLAQHPARVVVHVDGLAASIASVIAMAGDEIRMGDGSFMMIHEAWGVAVGDAAKMRATADLLTSVSGTIADTYAVRTKQDRKKIDKWMADERWLTAQEAVADGFADIVAEPVRAAAALQDRTMPDGSVLKVESRFKNMPAALRPRRAAALAKIAAIRG